MRDSAAGRESSESLKLGAGIGGSLFSCVEVAGRVGVVGGTGESGEGV